MYPKQPTVTTPNAMDILFTKPPSPEGRKSERLSKEAKPRGQERKIVKICTINGNPGREMSHVNLWAINTDVKMMPSCGNREERVIGSHRETRRS